MLRSFSLLTLAAVSLAACVETTQQLGSDGKPLPQLYRIRAGETSAIQFRMLDSVNALRQAAGATPVQMNAQLNAAAATHARDMAIQNRPWHFGSDGSSPWIGWPGWATPVRWWAKTSRKLMRPRLKPSPPGWNSQTPAVSSWPPKPATWASPGIKKSTARSGGPWLWVIRARHRCCPHRSPTPTPARHRAEAQTSQQKGAAIRRRLFHV